MYKLIIIIISIFVVIGGYLLLKNNTGLSSTKYNNSSPKAVTSVHLQNQSQSPLTILAMRQRSYPPSPITIEQTLSPGSNYKEYLASYKSDGLKIYALLTIPTSVKPNGGYPVILFNHGYIPPATYSTGQSYQVMVEPLASAGYIVFKPDYRGNGNSQGSPAQIYISPDYATDSLNALSAIKNFKDANAEKIGVLGHSMGGNITLHELVVSKDIKAAELLSGVVGNETELLNWWNHRFITNSISGNDLNTYYILKQMISSYGTPSTNPTYWNSIDPTKFIETIQVPIQIQVGSADEEVPQTFSINLKNDLISRGKTVDFRSYEGADHNLSPDQTAVMNQTIAFFDRYLK